MNVIQRIFVILMIALCIFSILPQKVVRADVASIVGGVTGDESAVGDTGGKLATIVSKILGLLRIASGLIAILMIAFTGFNYIVGTPEIKDEMKKKMVPIIIGLILVFGATFVAQFLITTVAGIGGSGSSGSGSTGNPYNYRSHDDPVKLP